jgi:hypothetical protein
LDAPRQLILPFRHHKGVFPSHFQIAVSGNFRRFDRAPADLLPPSNIGATE